MAMESMYRGMPTLQRSSQMLDMILSASTRKVSATVREREAT
jgi:hypothetical protein